MADYPIDALQCDKCGRHELQNSSTCNADTGNNCLWIPKNNVNDGECSHKCKARLTKGECEQYQGWNKSELSPVIYDFSGNDNECIWHPNDYSVDETHDSTEGVCRAIDSKCFETIPTTDLTTDQISQLGEIYCGYYYSGHDNLCFNNNPPNCGAGCEIYKDPRVYDLPSDVNPENKGVCVSDGTISYDLETGENKGPLMSDEDCGDIKSVQECMDYHGYGCLWEPFNDYCIPKVPQPPKEVSDPVPTLQSIKDTCKPIDGHLSGNYDVNMLEEENINVSEYRDRNNKKYPYFTSKYLCDICHIRDNDLDNMKKLSLGGEDEHNKLKYYMIKKYVDFGDDDVNTNRSTTNYSTPEQYCEREIDDTHDSFNPCIWDTSGDNSASSKGGKCVSKCSKHSPVDDSVRTPLTLEYHKDQCVSDKWFPEDTVRDIQFPNLLRGSETDDDYFDDRYCTWDGFECHNSIPCKFAQQTRCEDLGYEWYEGTAIDIMNQPNDTHLGIPLDLSSSYPIERKGDGKPVEGNMQGICVYPNVEAGFISQPREYIINPQYIGEQVIMIKWREYGSGWWKDMSCKRKMDGLTMELINGEEEEESYFLGENVALVPFTIKQGDKCEDIKISINTALQNYQYFVYNGEWVMYAEDLIHAIDRSYDSSIDENDMGDSDINKYRKCYGYKYYSNTQSLEGLPDDINNIHDRKILNTLYDLRGTINLLPVVNQHCVLEIQTFTINSNSGEMSFTFHRPTEIDNAISNDISKFQFVEFIGTEIFKEGDPGEKLNLTVLSRYNYLAEDTGAAETGAEPGLGLLPDNIVKGYGTLYENKSVNSIIPYDSTGDSLINNATYDIRNPDQFDAIKAIINGLSGDGAVYSDDELKAWAPYNEFINFNVFSQPVITIKDELYKAKCSRGGRGGRGGRTNQLCSGSIESWKYLIGNTAPTYQTLDLLTVNGLLKLMAQYLKDEDIIDSRLDVIDGSPLTSGNKDNYINNIQPKTGTGTADTESADIKKAALWSITRNTPPFWGNLFYNRGHIGGSGENNYYLSCGNFNVINPTGDTSTQDQSTLEYAQCYGIRLPFNYDIDGNTLIKPFCEDKAEDKQYILWKNIMSYTGGNKRVIQLSRNVRNSDYNSYVSSIEPTLYSGLDATLYQDRDYTGPGYTGPGYSVIDTYYMGLPYTNLLTTIRSLDLKSAKKEYIERSLSDWLRLPKKGIDPNKCGDFNSRFRKVITADQISANYLNVDTDTRYSQKISRYNGSAWNQNINSLDTPPGLSTCDEYDSGSLFTGRVLEMTEDLCNNNGSCSDSTKTRENCYSPDIWTGNSYWIERHSPLFDLVVDKDKLRYKGGDGAASQTRNYCGHSGLTGFEALKNTLTTKVMSNGINYGFFDNSIGAADASGNLPPDDVDSTNGLPYYHHWVSPESTSNYNYFDNIINNEYDIGEWVWRRNASRLINAVFDTNYDCHSVSGNHRCSDNLYMGCEANEAVGLVDDLNGVNNVYNHLYQDVDNWDSIAASNNVESQGSQWAGVDICCGTRTKTDCTTKLEDNAENLPGYKNNGCPYRLDGPPNCATSLEEALYGKRPHLFPGIGNNGLGYVGNGPKLNSHDSPDIYYDNENYTNHNILSLHRLSRTPITDHEDVLKSGGTWIDDITATKSILYPWGKKYESPVGNEDGMWTEFKTNEYGGGANNHKSMINQLYYPLDTDDTSDITKPNGGYRDEKDKLRAWCMSTSDSLTDDFMVKSPAYFSKLNHINPDNDENQVGIIIPGDVDKLGYNILNNEEYIKNNTEFFDMEKETNAYKYPEICEPWYLKNRTGDRDKLAKYDYTMNKWSNSIYDDQPSSGYNPPSSGYNPLTQAHAINFDTLSDNNAPNLMNMIYPLSITSARPREKVIYLDITPNNDIFKPIDDKYINIYYFPNTLGNPTVEQLTSNIQGTTSDLVTSTGDLVTSTGANVDDIVSESNQGTITGGYNNSVLNRYDINIDDHECGKYFWLSPGLEPPSPDTESYVSIIGKNGIEPFTDDATPSSQRANYQVAYFKFVHDLLTGAKIIQESTTVAGGSTGSTEFTYKFTKDIFTISLVGGTSTGIPDMLSIPSNSGIKSIFFNTPGATDNNRIQFPTDYYSTRLPPQTSLTTIGKDLFGTGKANTIEGTTPLTSPPMTLTTDRYQVGTTDQMKYFNINMVFGTGNTQEDSDQIEICRDLIRNKVSECGNPSRWTNPDDPTKTSCGECFQVINSTNIGMCPSYREYILGVDEGLVITDVNELSTSDAKDLGVCGILKTNDNIKTPWDYIDITHEPENFGKNLPTEDPYNIDTTSCNNLPQLDINYIPIEQSPTKHVFFKPARSESSDIFYGQATGDDNKPPYACAREDLSLINKDNIKLSCNTNLSTPVERDKHVLINFIIKHSELSTSDRTKLAIMTEEELINKALDLEIGIETINEYTRPKLYKKMYDTFNKNICENSDVYCDENNPCDNGGICGRYEGWNDLQKYYYNISNETKKNNFIMRKEWEPVGCGIDLNYNDSSSGESICKDKYPGLCEKNAEKCNSDNKQLKEAIMLDCPETCKVQYTDFERYKNNQIGELSICTARGRCKWSSDDDASNLLPLCEDNTSRELGSSIKCANYNLSPVLGGPDAGTCNLRDYPETLSSPVCAEQRCTSMEGCVFTKQKSRYCKVESGVNQMIVNEVDCPKGGRWIGPSTGGQCIMDEQDLYEDDLQDFEQDCNILGGTIIDGQEQSCDYIPDIPYIGEDPCSHTVNLDDLTEDEMSNYFFGATSTITVDSITPKNLQGESNEHPDYITITLNVKLDNTNINDFDLINGLDEFPNNKYIYIDNNTNLNSVCSEYILGKSKIIKYENTDTKTEITIGGPNKAYILPRYTEDSQDGNHKIGDIYFGGNDACVVKGIYDIENYYVNSGDITGESVAQRQRQACYSNPNGACNYELSKSSDDGDCVSCSLYKDEASCFGNNDTNIYSRCGWGSIKDMCEVIGEMDECKKMHLDGCEWDPKTEKCSLNKFTDDDGNPLVDKVGCVKCNDIGHKNTCNSMKNCFWDSLTNKDGDNIGECRACSSIDDEINDIEVTNLEGNVARCDEFQLTQGQCEFRNPNNKVSGFESEFKLGIGTGFLDLSTISSQAESSWKVIWNAITGSDASDILTDNIKSSECSENPENCKCSPTRLYPFFPDWIIHNLVFFIVFVPFIVYFAYAWYKVLISPDVFENELVKIGEKRDKKSASVGKLLNNIKNSIGDSYDSYSSEKTKTLWFAKKTIEKTEKLAKKTEKLLYEGEIGKAAFNKLMGGAKIGTRYTMEGAEAEFNPLTDLLSKFDTNLSLNINGELFSFDTKGFFGGILDIYIGEFNFKESFKSIFNPILGFSGEKLKLQFDNLMPATDKETRFWCAPLRDKKNLKSVTDYLHFLLYLPFLFINPIWFFKTIFMIVSLPFTILQLLTYNVRLSIPKRLTGLCAIIANTVIKEIAPKAALAPSLLGLILYVVFVAVGCLIYLITPFVLLGTGYYFMKKGIEILLEFTSAGVSPNPNYVDPVEGVTHVDKKGNVYQASAVWPRRLYREEWDDMIKDPIHENVIEQRESLLPDILQGDPDDESNILDVYKIAYLEVEPESLNWSQSLRDIGTYYNKFINRLGDNFLFTFVLAPFIIYKYITSVSDYFPKEGEVFQIKDVLLYTVGYAIIFGIISVIMTRSDTADNEYDGVETKCYDDIPTPFTMGDGSPINYPKLCYGDSLDEDKNECPYGCYYIGDDEPKKCKDNRSGLSLSGFLEPEPRLNIPFPTDNLENGNKIPHDWQEPVDWFRAGETGKEYVCPPKSRFLTKYPYDSLCSPTAKRCKSRSDNHNLLVDGDDYCETLYMKNDYNDDACINDFNGGNQRYDNSDFENSARGPVTNENNILVNCELHLPRDGYKKDKFCPFPLPAAEVDYFSEKTDTRSSIELWNLAYNKIRNPGKEEFCTYICEDPSKCSLNENTYKDLCENVDMSVGDPETICSGTTLTNGSTCDYFPENIPLQQSVYNQERYLIVNEEYGGNLFR